MSHQASDVLHYSIIWRENTSRGIGTQLHVNFGYRGPTIRFEKEGESDLESSNEARTRHERTSARASEKSVEFDEDQKAILFHYFWSPLCGNLIILQYITTMPVFSPNPLKQQQLLQAHDLGKTRSSESTVDTSTGQKKSTLPSASSAVTPSSSPSRPPSSRKPEAPWRTKDFSSIFRDADSSQCRPNQEDMWTIQRCDAFDEDDDDS